MEGISLFRWKYVLDMLSRASAIGCTAADELMDPNLKLLPDQEKFVEDHRWYMKLVGKVNYLTMG